MTEKTVEPNFVHFTGDEKFVPESVSDNRFSVVEEENPNVVKKSTRSLWDQPTLTSKYENSVNVGRVGISIREGAFDHLKIKSRGF